MSESHRKIIEIATKLMSEKGYHGASIKKIADRVGVTKSTIFHHFKNKERILLSILEETVPQATQDLKRLLDDRNLDGREKLREFIKMHLRMVRDKGMILNLYLGESKHLSKKSKGPYLAQRRAYGDLVRQIIRQIIAEEPNSFKTLSPTILTNALLGMCNWSVTWFKKGGELDLDGVADQFYQIVCGPYGSQPPHSVERGENRRTERGESWVLRAHGNFKS